MFGIRSFISILFVSIVIEMVLFALVYLIMYCTLAIPASSGGDHVREMLLALMEELVRFTGVLIGATAECHNKQSLQYTLLTLRTAQRIIRNERLITISTDITF